jgi:hypothetical protein
MPDRTWRSDRMANSGSSTCAPLLRAVKSDQRFATRVIDRCRLRRSVARNQLAVNERPHHPVRLDQAIGVHRPPLAHTEQPPHERGWEPELPSHGD